MFIAIEGMDGVGKTTLAKNIAESTNFQYVEKPMQKVLGMTDEQYCELCNFIWSKENKNVTLNFFMLGNLLTRYYANDIVVDRHILSSYYWDGNDENKDVFSYFYQGDIIPDLTLVLYGDVEIRRQRIFNRNSNDPDLNEHITMDYGYDKMIDFANKIKMSYIMVNTNNRNEKEVFEYVSEIIMDYLKNRPQITSVFCEKYNNKFYNEIESPKIMALKKI